MASGCVRTFEMEEQQEEALTLNMMSGKKKIQRRLGHPENLNASILGGILRRAKSKNGGRELRETLEKLGLNLPAGRRKSATVTLLTSMVEGEAEHLGRDFSYICEKEFPAKALGQHVVATRKKLDSENIQKRREDLNTALAVVNEMINMMSKPIDPALKEPLDTFNLYTHNFGTTALLAGYLTMKRFIEAQIQCLTEVTLKPKPTATEASINQANILLSIPAFQNSNFSALASFLKLAEANKAQF
ncbi:unnamed protein product [Caenorhabditis auriculariae]|uniref:Transcription factor AP-2 C-terminal domain-containing protein n=1 Tax=Caenorhabditis auriculariae TaxID=2777116 RepID=A0A8S1HHA1_9PELO|nr:unnamed protein product [Caenorhabditis auriculariae]